MSVHVPGCRKAVMVMLCAYLQGHKEHVSVQRPLDLGELVHGKASLLIKSKHLRRDKPDKTERGPLILGKGSVLVLAWIIKDRRRRLHSTRTCDSVGLCRIHGQADCPLDVRRPASRRKTSFVGSLLNGITGGSHGRIENVECFLRH